MNGRALYTDNKKLTCINFFSGPGAGKSTCAAELFAKMKKQGNKVELVHEAAKDFVWEDWGHIFGEQDWIFAHQHRLIRRLVRHDIDYAVIDSSILLSLFYMPEDFPQSFRPFVRDVFDSYDNINILIDRNPDFMYDPSGRNENEVEAIAVDIAIREYFETTGVPVYHVLAGDDAAANCLAIVNRHPRS